MTRACIYFGEHLPDRGWAEGLGAADLVLEPFHPLVKDGGFADWFPSARRFVYVNPTTVDPWLLGRVEGLPPIDGWDQRWDLPRLDIAVPEAMEWAVRTAAAAARLDGGRSHGLFVDDLDRFEGDRQDLALEFLLRVEAEVPTVRWFINRGFRLWPRIGPLDAVLLEDIAPRVSGAAAPDAARWLREVVIASVREVRERGVAVHAMAYADQEPLTAEVLDRSLEQELHDCLDSVLTGVARNVSNWKVSA